MMAKQQNAISTSREESYPEWYQQVLKASDLAENAPVRGCMTIKPWGYAIWENIQKILDKEIKRTGHENAYFPLFIPLSFLEKEAKHVDGFAKECAVVTHHRLEQIGGRLVPTGELEEPLVVRPTSEMIIGDSFSRWIKSWRDLPVLINQWANVVRWEMRPRIFLRTTEFLWQEGHTAHATEEEALEEAAKMLDVYIDLVENALAIPVIAGKKSPGERFPGAVETFTFEMMMQDRKALQGGTSHYLGQNFSKAQNIAFTDQEGRVNHPYMTSWGVTTRLIGGLIMVHGDDDGLRLPPKIAPLHTVVLPIVPKPEAQGMVSEYCVKISEVLEKTVWDSVPVSFKIDERDLRGGEKNWEWIKKGVPLRIEAGPRDIENGSVMVSRRDEDHKKKAKVLLNELPAYVERTLGEIQNRLFVQAKKYRDAQICREVHNFEEMKRFFTSQNPNRPEIHGGFVLAKWCGDPATEDLLKELKVTIRCLPLEQSGTEGTCVITGKPAILDAVFAKSY